MSDEYELIAPHTLDRMPRKPGYRFSVSKSIGDWLVDDLKVAVRVGAAAPTPKPAALLAAPWRPAPRCCGWNK